MKRIRIFDDDFPAHFGMVLNYEQGVKSEESVAWINVLRVEVREE